MMKKKKAPIIIFGLLILATLIILSVFDVASLTITCTLCNGTGLVEGSECGLCDGVGVGHGSIWALLPAIIAITLSLITKEVFSSLFIGILSGAIIATRFSFVGTVDEVINTGLIPAVVGSAGIFIFLVELGIIVALINKSGGSESFGVWAKKHVKTKVGASVATFLLGVLIFIDDYFNCLTVGSVMKPVTDKHKISREKLAFLIDSTAAPICMIAPISSWAAAVSKYASDGNGFELFIKAIPMNFYCILTIVFVLTITILKFDFGTMKKFENQESINSAFESYDDNNANTKAKLIDLLLPIIFLIIFSVFSLIYVGGFFTQESSNYMNFISSFADTDATIALPWSGLVCLVFTMVYFLIRRTISFEKIVEAIPEGFKAMVPAILILTFATTLKNITSTLGAAFYVGNLMNGTASTLMAFLPAVIFLVSCGLSFATGTSWGTFGILIPIVTAIFISDPTNPLLILGISACLAGAVCGDHFSPISDTTIMASAGSECNHINHVSSQLPYSIYIACVSFVCFLIAGFIPIWYIMLPLSIAIMIISLIVTRRIVNKKEALV